jgi:hypothetical protein
MPSQRKRRADRSTVFYNKSIVKMTTTAHRAMAQAIQAARRRLPNISADGIRIAVRGGPFQDILPDQVMTAIECLSILEPTKTGRVDSYRLKHVAEAWGSYHEMSGYVSNGALITAALAIELFVEPCGPPWSGSPNCMIGVSEKSVRRMIAVNAFIRNERRGLIDSGNRATI